jgi:hypothetical protein
VATDEGQTCFPSMAPNATCIFLVFWQLCFCICYTAAETLTDAHTLTQRAALPIWVEPTTVDSVSKIRVLCPLVNCNKQSMYQHERPSYSDWGLPCMTSLTNLIMMTCSHRPRE